MDKKTLFRKKIIRQLYFSPNLSCTDLSERIGKSLPVTTRLLLDLVEDGFVAETGFAPSTGGRRPQTYSLVDDTMYIVSVAMDQFVTRIVIMDLRNNHVGEISRFELPLADNPKALDILIENIQIVIEQSGIPQKKIIGVGIGMPGFVDTRKGINHSYFRQISGSLREYLEKRMSLPVFIDNDSSVIALAEHRFGAARNIQHAMVINIGWGIGLGMIVNGNLFRGQSGFAGEFSHIPLFNNTILCSCGKTGCLETETSMLVMIEKARKGLKEGRVSKMKLSSLEHYEQASEALISAAIAGDQFAVELFSEDGYNIGRGIAILIHILNPEVIVLSGRGSAAGKVWLAPIQQAINKHCIPRIAANTVVELSELGHHAELLGSAVLVMENFEMPRIPITDYRLPIS
jgi:predicted NBD/HSP70 family sugar kinase